MFLISANPNGAPGRDTKSIEEVLALRRKFIIEVPDGVAEVFGLKDTSIGIRDMELIIRAIKNESMAPAHRQETRERLVELALILERIIYDEEARTNA